MKKFSKLFWKVSVKKFKHLNQLKKLLLIKNQNQKNP
jgi:hypothetical protein